MQTLVVHTQNPAETKAVKAVLKALKIKVDVFENVATSEPLAKNVLQLLDKSLAEMQSGKLTNHEEFFGGLKAKLK